jgi:hypothetical protein
MTYPKAARTDILTGGELLGWARYNRGPRATDQHVAAALMMALCMVFEDLKPRQQARVHAWLGMLLDDRHHHQDRPPCRGPPSRGID